ncbi:hypothetical protein ACFL14_02610 [Patescibacteria group bacterium]
MNPNPKHHYILDRIILIILILLGLSIFWYFRYDRIIQLAIVAALLAIYLIWGIIHHLRTKTLTNAIILEYLAVVLIVVVLILSSLN